MDRREFLRGAALAAGGMATCGALSLAVAEAEERWAAGTSLTDGDWIPSCCNMCGGQTGILCQVVDGRLVRIRPNPFNPNGFTNISDDFVANGSRESAVMCPKGNAGIMTLYDPDRLRTPLRRTNPQKGIGIDPGFVEISWEEAYRQIVERLRQLREAGEPHKLLWFAEDHSFTHIQQDFLELFGSPNWAMHSNLCDVARKASFRAVMGDDRPLMDSLQSRYILLFGWNPLGATKWAHLPRIVTRAMERGAKLVVVDPYLSETANKADEWIPIRPGTDGALALAMCHVIVQEELYDRDFVRDWTHGFDEFAAYVQDKTPEWGETVTSVPAQTIARIAREFATTKPAVLDVWSGPGQHDNGVHGGAAIACLAALVGGYERPGTLLIPDKQGNKHGHVHTAPITAPRFGEENKLYPLWHKSGVYTEMFQRLADGSGPYRPSMAVIVFQNVLMSVPGTETVARALANLDFVVVNDIFLSETAQFADIVIPGTTYLERYDLNTHWVTWPALGLRQPVVPPLFGQPTEYEFVIELGRRLDLKDADGHDFFWLGPLSGQHIESAREWYEDYLSNELVNGAPKMTLEQLKALPGATWVSPKGTRYEKYREAIAPEKMEKATIVRVQVGGVEVEQILDKPKAEGGKRIGTIIASQPVRGFFTPTGRVEFVMRVLEGKKDRDGNPCDTLPVYKPRSWQPDADYPLYLINWKEASHTHARTQNNRWLLEIKPDNPLIIREETAHRLGIRDGDEVWVESPFGRVRARAKIVQGIHPEVVGLQHGFGHWAMGRAAKGRGTSDAALRPTKSDPISGQSLHKQCCVKVYKA